MKAENSSGIGACQYDRYLAAGCPIATGVIEGACRYLVRDRMVDLRTELRALRASRGGTTPGDTLMG